MGIFGSQSGRAVSGASEPGRDRQQPKDRRKPPKNRSPATSAAPHPSSDASGSRAGDQVDLTTLDLTTMDSNLVPPPPSAAKEAPSKDVPRRLDVQG